MSGVAGRVKWGSMAALAVPVVIGWAFCSAWGGKYSFAEAWSLFLGAKDPAVNLPWQAAVALGLRIASVLATVVFLAAAVTWKFWCPARVAAGKAGKVWCPWWLWLPLLIAAASTRSELARGSMWWDELWNVRYATVGEWRPDNAGEPHFKPTTWDRALYYYNKPTNHPVQTVPGKFGHETWRKLTGAAPGAFSEWVLRLPVLLAGMAAMILCVRMASRWGGKPAAVATGLVFTLHPWLIRYGVDARSYGITLLLVPLTIEAIWQAVTPAGGGAMRWWWVTGLGLALLMWAHPLSHLGLCAGLFAAAVLVIFRNNPKGMRGRLVGRLTVVSAAGAGLFSVLFLPCLLQTMRWHERNNDGNMLTVAYFQETFSQLTLGVAGGTAASAAGAILFLAMAGGGALVLVRRDRDALVIMLSVIAGLALYMAGTAATGMFFFHRFIIGMAGPLAVLAGLCFSRRVWRLPTLAAGVVWIWQGYLQKPAVTGISPMREAALAMKAARDGSAAPGRPPGIIACYGMGANMLQCYVPDIIDLRGKDGAGELRSLVDRARAEHRPLWVAWGYDAFMSVNYPDGFAQLKDPGVFRFVEAWEGIEPDFGFQVVRLVEPGAGFGP